MSPGRRRKKRFLNKMQSKTADFASGAAIGRTVDETYASSLIRPTTQLQPIQTYDWGFWDP